MQAPQPKSWIAAIDPYVPGKAIAGGKPAIKLSANESPLGPSPHAVIAMAQVHGNSHRYPDGSSLALRTKIGALHGIDPAQIICGTGSDEILNLAAQAFAGPGDEVLFSRHSFMVYPIAARRCGATPVEAPDSDYVGDVDALLACVTPRTRVIFIANPNNPTGTLMRRAEVLRLYSAVPQNILLVLDAAYAEFVSDDYESGLELSQTAPNVLHTRTFSKIYGLAAERVGWGTASPAIIEALNRIRGPFNVTTAATAGACAALDDQAWIKQARAHNDKWLGWINSEIIQLGNYGLRAIPSAANFVLIEFSGINNITAERGNAFLQSEGYVVRWLPGQGLGNCLRVTIGTEAENIGFMQVLRTFCETAA